MSFRRPVTLRSNGGLKLQVVEDFGEKIEFFEKNDPLRENVQNSVQKGFTVSPIHVLCTNCVKFGRLEIGKVVCYLPDEKKQKFDSLFRCGFCTDRAQNLPRPAADNVLRLLQISSKIGSLPAEV